MKIRHAIQSDFRDIASIHIASWKDAYTDILPAEFFKRQINSEFTKHWNEVEIQDDDLIWVAEEHSLIGFIAVWCRPEAFIDNLHVLPSMRSKNTGTVLMRAAARELIHRGHDTAYLWVFESNLKAIRFYERLGGVQKEKAVKNIFGYGVPSRKIEWDDLSLIG